MVALHVFNNSLFVDYDVMDAEAIARRESARFVEEAKAIIREKADGVRASLFTTEGDPEEAVISFAREKQADVMLCPPSFKGIIGKYQRALNAAEPGSDLAKDVAVLTTKTM